MAYCPNCGAVVTPGSNHCQNCGVPLYVGHAPRRKDEGEVAIISLALGLVGIMGGGHFYLGEVGRGAMFLVLGLLPFLVMVLAVLATIPGDLGAFVALAAVAAISWLVILVVQTFDAYRRALEQPPRNW